MAYMTEPRKRLLAFFKANPDTLLRVHEITEAMEAQGMSRSAVYRNLTLFTEQGLVTRVVPEGEREGVYQYFDTDACQNCLHFTCMVCGAIYHLRKTTANAVTADILHADGFEIDRKKTVLYGRCKRCRG